MTEVKPQEGQRASLSIKHFGQLLFEDKMRESHHLEIIEQQEQKIKALESLLNSKIESVEKDPAVTVQPDTQSKKSK